MCNRFCPDYEPDICQKHLKVPYVCNGCGRRPECVLEKRLFFDNFVIIYFCHCFLLLIIADSNFSPALYIHLHRSLYNCIVPKGFMAFQVLSVFYDSSLIKTKTSRQTCINVFTGKKYGMALIKTLHKQTAAIQTRSA